MIRRYLGDTGPWTRLISPEQTLRRKAVDERIRQAMVNVKGAYCRQVYFKRCVGQVVGQECSKAHESLLISGREGAIPVAKVNIVMLGGDKHAKWKVQVLGWAETDTSGSSWLKCGQKRLGNHVWSQVSLRWPIMKTLKLKVWVGVSYWIGLATNWRCNKHKWMACSKQG